MVNSKRESTPAAWHTAIFSQARQQLPVYLFKPVPLTGEGSASFKSLILQPHIIVLAIGTKLANYREARFTANNLQRYKVI